MPKNKIIDIDAEFDGLEFDESAISRATGIKKRSDNPDWHKNRQKTYSSLEYRERRKEQFSSAEVKENMAVARKHIMENTDWLKNVSIANKRRANENIEWNRNVTEANKQKAKDPNWYNAVATANKQKAKDPNSAYSKAIQNRDESNNIKKNKLLSSKQCVTPYGVFWSRADAAKFIFENKIIPTRKTESSLMSLLAGKFKNNPKEYYYISKEEYIMLTGKEL